MQPLSISPSLSLLWAQENAYLAYYRKILEKINEELQTLRQRPSFLSFVNYKLNATFTTDGKRLEANRIFIAQEEEGEARVQAGNEPAQLLPSLLDSVVRRIIDKQSASIATRSARFTYGRGKDDDKALPSSLTAAAFDSFIDDLADSLEVAYKGHLDEFWNKKVSETDSNSYKQKVIARRSDHIRAEATLLRGDGTLNSGSVLLVEEFLKFDDAASRQARPYRPAAYALLLTDGNQSPAMPLHGALVLTSRDPSYSPSEITATLPAPCIRPITPSANVGFCLLFTPSRGLEAFPSLALLDKELHRRIQTDHEFESLFVLLADKDAERAATLRDKAQPTGCFDYTEILESVFTAIVESQYEKLIQDFTFMVGVYQARGVDADMSQLPASLDLTVDMNKLFDLNGVLIARGDKRLKAELNEFLNKASATDKEKWATATREYLEALQSVSGGEGLPSISQFSDREALLDYSKTQLLETLETEYGIDADPDEIRVSIRRPNPGGGIYFSGARPNPQTGQAHYTIETKTLTELALENVEYFDEVFVEKSKLTLDKLPYTALTTQQVKDLIREVDIGDSYDSFLKKRLLTSAEALSLKKDYVRVLEKQLRVDALEAKISGDYLPGSLERAYNWVNRVIDHPVDTDQRAMVDGHKVTVCALFIRDIEVRGVLVFRSATSSSHSKVVYTPQAPGGRVFHEYQDSTQLLERFINNSAWHNYLFSHMEGAYQPRLRKKLASGIFFNEFGYSTIRDNFLERCYNTEAQNTIEKANRSSTSTHEADVRSAWTIVGGVVEVVLAVFPVRVTFAIGLVRSMFALNQAVEALQKDDNVTATHEFIRAISHLIGALVDGAVGFAPVRVSALPQPAGLPSHMAIKSAPKGVIPLAGWEGKGIYTRPGKGSTPGQHFLHEKDLWYKVTYDEASGPGVWRLQRKHRSGEHQYHLPPITRNALNEWIIRSPETGLRGGVHSQNALNDLRRLYPDLDARAAGRVLDAFQFPAGAERAWELQLVRQMALHPQAAPLRGVPLEFQQHLSVSLNEARLRLQGIEQVETALATVFPPARGSVIANNSWRTWGRARDATSLEPHPDHPGVLMSKTGWPRSQPSNCFIKVDGLYYSIFDDAIEAGSVYVCNYFTDYLDSFDQFELMIRLNPADQPRLATYDSATSRWHVSDQMPFEKSLGDYVAEAFPALTPESHSLVARSLFQASGARRFHSGYRRLGLLHKWRTGRFDSGDPLSMLEPTPHVQRRGYFIGRRAPGQATPGQRLEISFNELQPHFHHAMTHPGEATSQALLSEAMIRLTGASVVEDLSAYGIRYFKRTGDDTVYCLHTPRLNGNYVTEKVRIVPERVGPGSAQYMDETLRSAFDAGKLVNLIWGVKGRVYGHELPHLFIVRVATPPI